MLKISVAISPEKTGFGPLLFSGDLERGIKTARDMGFDGVELSLRDSSILDLDRIGKLLSDCNLEVSSIATGQTYYSDGFSLCDARQDVRDITVGRLKQHAKFAQNFGAVVIIGGVRGRFAEKNKLSLEKTCSAVKEVMDYAESLGVVCVLEVLNRYETNFVNTATEAKELMRRMECRNLKILLDTFHMNIEEASLPGSIEDTGSYLGLVHIADSNRLAPGWGHLNFEEILSSLIRIEYLSYVCAEILPVPDDTAAAKQAATYLRKLLGG
jgi:sugar phosphate isomerase/epimerase